MLSKRQPLKVCPNCENEESELATLIPPEERAPRVLTEENAWIMYSMLRDVITRGTAQKAKALKRKDLAGKTGTTNDQRDAWFSGYNGAGRNGMGRIRPGSPFGTPRNRGGRVADVDRFHARGARRRGRTTIAPAAYTRPCADRRRLAR